jgi:S1-C subfamily serine protease
MRTVQLTIVLLALTAPTVAAQTRVSGVRSVPDSVRVEVRVAPQSPEQLRVLIAELTALAATQRDLEGQLRALMRTAESVDNRRVVEVQSQLARTWSEYFPRQSALTVACQSARAVPPGSGYIGITFDDELMVAEAQPGRSEVTFRFAGTPRITAVEPGSPAERVGLRVGDEWVAIGGSVLAGMRVDDVVARLRPGTKHQLRVRRDGREWISEVTVAARMGVPEELCAQAATITLRPTQLDWRGNTAVLPGAVELPRRTVTLPAPMPMPERTVVMPGRSLTFIATSPTVYGARFRVLDADVREFVSYRGAGILVDQVTAGSPAEAAGLKAFDVVSAANGAPITAVEDLMRVTGEARRVELTVQRKGVTRTVVLTR